jgi:hypothetical protein
MKKQLFTKEDAQDVESLINQFDDVLMSSVNIPSVFRTSLTSAERSLLKTFSLWLLSRESVGNSSLKSENGGDK